MQFLLSAGEASGDTYGAQLAEALGNLAPGSRFFGMGGEKMRAAGCELLVHANEVAVVGLVEVLTHLPGIRQRFKHLMAEAERRKADAAVLIDFPDFNLRLARELHRLGIPVFYFVSPQIWAWRTGRIRQIKKYVRKMIVIFPFEQEFYRQHGVEVSYVGHPLAYVPPSQITRKEFAAQHGLDAGKQWIALLPGSRRKEVRLNLPAMLQAAELLQQQSDYECILPVASTLNAEWLKEQINQVQGGRSSSIHLTDNARATLIHARVAAVASGTATVEAALSGTPFVVVYRLALLTWLLGRRLVKLDTFAMANLIAGEKVVPELIQKDFTAVNVVREVKKLLPDGPDRQKMQAALKMVQQRLHDSQNADPPALRAAREVLASLR
ncbi:MAG TPA: lipid-A-disaccharide synthase [Candidatus Angelobacter sp.]|nr:lipid-A-disaccharide synthase [Candidatus Angelobacter sp.]